MNQKYPIPYCKCFVLLTIGQIKIIQHPKRQKQKEGFRVEFSCKCEVPGGTQVSYQWLKDDQELEGKTSDTLLLESVRIQDFGLYRCQVSRSGDTGMEPVKSEPAELIVTPGLGKSENYCCAFFFLMKHRFHTKAEHKSRTFGEPFSDCKHGNFPYYSPYSQSRLAIFWRL